MSSQDEISDLLGGDIDYERVPHEYAEKLAPIHPSRAHIVKLLMSMIKQGQICIMDKETSVPMQASGIVGYKVDKIIIYCER